MKGLHLYKVDQGRVTNARATTRTNGRESVLVAATSRAGALKVAEAFDRGAVGIGEIEIRGKTVEAAWILDKKTETYV